MSIALLSAFVGAALALSPSQKAALATGDCATALAGSPGSVQPAEALALARCELRQGRPEAALTRLHRQEHSEFGAHVHLLAGEALLDMGRFEQAAAQLQQAVDWGHIAPRARMLWGRALVELGRFEQAREVLRAALTEELAVAGAIGDPYGADPAEVRWWLAQGAIRRGEPDKAVAVLSTLWVRNPSSPRAAEAAAWLSARGEAVPFAGSESGRALIRARIATLKTMNAHAEALVLWDMIPRGEGPDEARSEAVMAFKARDYPRSVAAYAKLSGRSGVDQFQYALATSRTGDYAAAHQRYEHLVKTQPTHKRADTASYKLGYLAYDEGRLAEAIPLFEAHLVRYPATKHKDEALWFLGWASYRLGKLDDARRWWKPLVEAGGGLGAGAVYWQARMAADAGDADGAKRGFERVLQSWPYSGYAWFASHALDRRYPRKPLASAPGAPASLDTPGFKRGKALAEVGLDGWARDELLPLRGGARAAGKDASLALAWTLVQAGASKEAKELVKSRCARATSTTADPQVQQVCFPRPAYAVVTPLADQLGLPPNLPYGIMTAESALDPSVTSIAGARGLMQLMPELAQTHHQARFGDTPYHPDALYQPAYNAALGVTELGSLRANLADTGLDPVLPAVIAGYNGGEEAVRRWLGLYESTPDADRFAEDISYTETRRYVRRVLGYTQTYRYVYGD